jgi:hypothetical protein
MATQTINLEDYMLNGKLRSFTSIGGYPLFYVTKQNNCLCPDCATDNDQDYDPIAATDVNWEDPDLYCDECSNRIESAYAEPE